MAMRWFVCMSALAALMVAGCAMRGGSSTYPLRSCDYGPIHPDNVLSVGCVESAAPLHLDRGDWAVSQGSEVWSVLEARENRPPERIGYLVRRRYRQMRGGPAYEIYTVSTLNRQEVIGRIDQMGRAYRYEPARNVGFDEVDLGISSLENGVGAIFDSTHAISLEPTTERRLAYEFLDRNGSGVLEPEEMRTHGDRLKSADANRDGLVDFAEFDAIPVL